MRSSQVNGEAPSLLVFTRIGKPQKRRMGEFVKQGNSTEEITFTPEKIILIKVKKLLTS